MKLHGQKDSRKRIGIRAGLAVAFLAVCALVAGARFSSPSAGAAELHGISFLKGCNSPTMVGEPYICTFQVQNVVDTAHDTLTISSLVDVVHAGAGDVTSINLLLTPTVLTLAGGATCNVGQTLCTLPFNSSITLTISYYNVHPGDPNPLTDTATLTWQDTCSPGTPTPNCPLGQTLHTQAGSQSEIQTPTPTPTNTPTPTATPTPHLGVGGKVQLPPAAIAADYGAANDESGWTAKAYAGLAGAVALTIVVLAGGAWYTRKRWIG